MILVLEGVDGAGKTTLTQKFVEEAERRRWEVEVWHRGVPERHPLEEYELDLEQDYAHNRTKRLIVCDRWHLGQVVYGELYRDDAKNSSLGTTWHVDAFLQSLGAVQLILSPPLDLVRKRLAERGEDYLRPEHVEHVHRRYEELGRTTFRRSIEILRDPLTSNDVHLICEVMQCRSERAEALREFPTYVGPRHPDLLLLGEAQGTGPLSAKLPNHRAAFVPYGGTSGRWLCDTIIDSELSQTRIGIANAGSEDVQKLVGILGHPQVVTMGNVADQIVTNLGVEHGSVPHPQYMRRFFNSYAAKYAEAIGLAATKNERVQPWLI
jgi:thymidylate kinase